MSCPYINNDFCKRLSSETRAEVCAHCTIKQFAQGQHLSEEYFAHKYVLILEGMMVKMELDPLTQKMTTSGIGCRGAIFSIGDVFQLPLQLTQEERTSICISDCVAAVFDMDFVRHLYQTNVEFVRISYQNSYHYCIREKAVMMRDIGRGDVYRGIRYVVKYCKEHGIPQLTHEQIALVTSRSRPTVTSVMHQLIKQEPE